MRSSTNEPPWYLLHHTKPFEGEITLLALATGRFSIDPPPSLPSRLARELKRLLPAGCKRAGNACICYFVRERPAARMRASTGICVELRATIHVEETELLGRLAAAGFRPLPPNTIKYHFI